ncbi:hypothetical protein [Thiohalorhabdus methylotrophus]|uniref:DUF481 domain-containing protein n=1 Tax=Thiohalorhabdus methylotrophus TaxID=3242694 RepID=A0ABV4TXL5_9GAMM
MGFRKLCSCILASGGILAAVNGSRAAEPDPRLGIHIGLESFRWVEEDPANTSRNLLVERGERIAGSLSWDNLAREGEGQIHRLLGRAYHQEVVYDGETQDGRPVETETEYTGALVEGRIGQRLAVSGAPLGLDVLGGVGLEVWNRWIKDTRIDDGAVVSGYEETYGVLYLKGGLGVAELSAGAWFGRAEVGIKYPLEIREEIRELDASLRPEERTSLYAVAEIAHTVIQGRDLGVTLYYESYRFGLSPTTSSTIGPVRQPESDMDVLGVQVGLFF